MLMVLSNNGSLSSIKIYKIAAICMAYIFALQLVLLFLRQFLFYFILLSQKVVLILNIPYINLMINEKMKHIPFFWTKCLYDIVIV